MNPLNKITVLLPAFLLDNMSFSVSVIEIYITYINITLTVA